MQTQTFQAKEMKEALALVRRELGPDAIIVGTRKVAGRGLFGGTLVEVAARPTQDPAQEDEPASLRMSPEHAESLLQSARANATPSIRRGNHHKMRMALGRASRLREAPPARSVPDAIRHRPEDALLAAAGDRLQRVSPHAALRRRLLGALVPRDLCESLLGQLATPTHQRADAEQELRTVLQEQLGDPHLLLSSGSRVAALVGPTGVGKTTTIAKLAAQATIYGEQRVALLSLDDHRIGAVAQLKAYASLLELPVKSCGSDQQLARALAEYRDADLILIDTPGVSLADESSLERLRQRLRRAGEPVTTHLCLSSSTRQEELDRITKLYSRLEPDAIIATKMDEAVAIGSVVSARLGTQAPFSFITNGQQVPEDLAPADAQLITDTLLGATRS